MKEILITKNGAKVMTKSGEGTYNICANNADVTVVEDTIAVLSGENSKAVITGNGGSVFNEGENNQVMVKAVNGIVKIDSISVKSMYKGKMYVAYKEAPADTITWEVEDSAELFLMEKQTVGDTGYFENSLANGKCALKKLDQIEMNGVDEVEVGDALFISPGGTKYELKLYVRYAIDGGVEEKKTIKVNFLHPDRNSKFEAGKSYHLNVTVYGLENIVVDTQIEKWIEEDEDIDVDSDGFQTHPDGKEELH
jgi:hypothetical protein